MKVRCHEHVLISDRGGHDQNKLVHKALPSPWPWVTKISCLDVKWNASLNQSWNVCVCVCVCVYLICKERMKSRHETLSLTRLGPNFNNAAVWMWDTNENIRNSWIEKGWLAQWPVSFKFIATHLFVLSAYLLTPFAYINMSSCLLNSFFLYVSLSGLIW